MWKPATRQITGTNDGMFLIVCSHLQVLILCLVPLGQRRRFGPAPADDAPAPQLAQPSPSAYPRSHNQEESPGKRGRDESPVNGDPKGKQTKNSLA
jgi:splicing factor 1